MGEEVEVRSFYDLTYEEDREELANLIKKGVKLDTTITAPEDLSEVKQAAEDLVKRLGAELVELDHSQWPKKLVIKFRFQGQERRLVLTKIEEGAYRPSLE